MFFVRAKNKYLYDSEFISVYYISDVYITERKRNRGLDNS